MATIGKNVPKLHKLHHHTRKIIHKNKLLKASFKFRYPKITLLVILIFGAYIIFNEPSISGYLTGIEPPGLLGAFIAGAFLAFGFTAPFAAGYLILISPESLLTTALVAGIGALIADLLIFKFIKISLLKEFNIIKKTKLIEEIDEVFDRIPFHVYLSYSIIGILIASPLPDEIAVSLLAGMTKIDALKLGIVCFILHTLGIVVLLLI